MRPTGQDLACLVHCFVPAPSPAPDTQCVNNREASRMLSYLKATKLFSTISLLLIEDMRLWVRNGQFTNHNNSSSQNTGAFGPVPWADPSPIGWQQKGQMIAAHTAGLRDKTWALSAENPKSGAMTVRMSVLHAKGDTISTFQGHSLYEYPWKDILEQRAVSPSLVRHAGTQETHKKLTASK